MARKKKYKDGELEQEFTRFSFYHKYIAVQTALIVFEKDGIYNSKYLKPFKNVTGSEEVSRAVAICNSLTDMHDKGDDSLLNELYTYCWNRLSPLLEECANFTEGFKASD